MIEVATPEGTPTKEKGDLLEAFAKKFLETQGFDVDRNVRVTASELDLVCRHKINGRTIYVECKAHRDPLGADVLKTLLGTVTFNAYQEGWLISTGPLGRDAKGFKMKWESRPPTDRQALSIYAPEQLVEALVAARLVTPRPMTAIAAAGIGRGDAALGEWLFVISSFGYFWLAPTLDSGVPSGVLAYDATTGEKAIEQRVLERLAATDCSLRTLDFTRAVRSPTGTTTKAQSASVHTIVEVAHGDSWTDYRPARPKDFVGRFSQQGSVLQLLENVRTSKTQTRVFAIVGDSGMGKSSLIAKLRERTRNMRNRRKYFTYALDSRAARGATYVLASLLSGLRAAAASGFGHSQPDDLAVSDHADPLSSPSVSKFLTTCQDRGQVICIVFDQFEELYSKPDLFDVFEEAQRLFLSAVSAASSLVLGFAWRSDSTVPQDHPAYYMWHRLADHRYEVALGPFSGSESLLAVRLFERELGERLHPELRRQVVENSRGYPWLLKKLCIHILDQVNSGTRQSDLRETLDAASLFDRDLQQLTHAQQTCLRAIAGSAPADWYEILEAYSSDVLRALQDKRLIVRSGDRVNVYWDIFREYLLTNRTPAIPFTYIPSSPSLDALLRVAAQLRHDSGHTLRGLAAVASLGEKTVGNIVHDLRMFGIAGEDHSAPRLDASVPSGAPRDVLLKIREVLRRHALTISLAKIASGEMVSVAQIGEELRQLNPAASHRDETWRFYAERLGAWLTATGLLDRAGSDRWYRRDIGDVVAPAAGRRGRGRGVFTGEAPPATVVQALDWLRQWPAQTYAAVSKAGYRNAVSVLTRYGVVARGKDGRHDIVRAIGQDGARGVVWRMIQDDEGIRRVVAMLRDTPQCTGRDIGEEIARLGKQNWKAASKTRVGSALRRWGQWVLAGEHGAGIPEPPEGRSRRRNTRRGNLMQDKTA